MPHPHTLAWHAHEEAQERAWLDDWARLHCITVLEEPALATAGSLR
jgi:hypothetical protein